MNANFEINGIHHVTAIASSAAENFAFYERVLGLRLAKKTVNFDDPYTYHLYYGDAAGTPGTLITFFPWQELPRGKTGVGMVAAVAFSIPADSFGYWRNRINRHGIATIESERFAEPVIHFEDPHGLPLELIASPAARSASIWKDSPIPPAHAIVGLHSATARLHSLDRTQFLLMDLMGMTPDDQQDNRYRFKMKNDDASGRFFDVLVDPGAQKGRQGGGTVHHIAFRTATADEQRSWRESLIAGGFSVTPIIDRQYFKSIYFHEPGGVLFEIATDPPGFTVDEAYERLGRDLKLPRQYEPMRAAIESRLPELQPGGTAPESVSRLNQVNDERQHPKSGATAA
jgi:glyoxalase family protein